MLGCSFQFPLLDDGYPPKKWCHPRRGTVAQRAGPGVPLPYLRRLAGGSWWLSGLWVWRVSVRCSQAVFAGGVRRRMHLCGCTFAPNVLRKTRNPQRNVGRSPFFAVGFWWRRPSLAGSANYLGPGGPVGLFGPGPSDFPNLASSAHESQRGQRLQ